MCSHIQAFMHIETVKQEHHFNVWQKTLEAIWGCATRRPTDLSVADLLYTILPNCTCRRNRLVSATGFRNNDPILSNPIKSKWTKNYSLCISFGSFKLEEQRSRFWLILAISASKDHGVMLKTGSEKLRLCVSRVPRVLFSPQCVCLLQPWGVSANDLQKLILGHKLKRTFAISWSMKLNTFPLAVPALIISGDLWQCHCCLFMDSVYTCIVDCCI